MCQKIGLKDYLLYFSNDFSLQTQSNQIGINYIPTPMEIKKNFNVYNPIKKQKLNV